jgi:hypothetical protein
MIRTLAFLALFLLSSLAAAGEVSMANGTVQFATPDSWVGIMQTTGDPEVQVFQVPDHSASGNTALARVSVTVKQVVDIGDFQQYVATATTRAHSLTGYALATASGAPNDFAYTAQESGERLSYRERYWFDRGHAVQLRCARPATGAAGASWASAFDKGCDAIATRLQS